MDRNYYYFVDKEGRIWHDGTEITDPRFAFLINRGIQRSGEDLRVVCQGETCHLQFEDVPYVVQDVAFHKDEHGALRQIDLIFAGGYTEILNPSTLTVSEDHVLYCDVREGQFPARFTRKAYFKIVPFIGEDPQGYYLQINRSRCMIRQPATPGRV